LVCKLASILTLRSLRFSRGIVSVPDDIWISYVGMKCSQVPHTRHDNFTRVQGTGQRYIPLYCFSVSRTLVILTPETRIAICRGCTGPTSQEGGPHDPDRR